MSTCSSLDCADAWAAPPLLQPNPDISGIGVLIGVFVTAYLSLILLFVHYILVFDPAEASLNNETYQANPIDMIILKFFAKWITRPQKTWEKAMEKIIVMMSDQQMVTGIALLSSAMIQLKCNISAYHWQITIYLVWFSSFTHLATLTFLRGYLYENSSLRWWRLFFMTALIGMLVAALVPTGNRDWLPTDKPALAGMPAICSFQYPSSENDSTTLLSVIFSVLVLCISYATRAIKLFAWSSKCCRLVFRKKPGDLLKEHLKWLYTGIQATKANAWILYIPYYICLSVLLGLRSFVDLLESMLWEIIWLLIALIWGTLRLFATRNATIDQDVNILEENSWGFGQCLATAMLVLLLVSGIETYIGTLLPSSELLELINLEAETRRLNRDGPSILTVAHGNASSVTVDNIEEAAAVSHSPPTERGNDNFVTNEASGEPTTLEDADITNQAILATETDEQLRRVARSPTSLSREERLLETLSGAAGPVRSSNNEFELQEFLQNTVAEPAVTTRQRNLPPHERNYYDVRWYKYLVVFNFFQIIFLSGGILSGAYSEYSLLNSQVGLFGSARNVGAIFINVLTWLLLYAPLSSFIITMRYVCFTGTHVKGRKLLAVVDCLLVLGVTVFSVMTSGQYALLWEDLFIGGHLYFFMWFYSISAVIYFICCLIVSIKLKRENIV